MQRGTTGVAWSGQHEPVGLVGAWWPAGNARVGVRQISFGRCCTGRGGALVRASPSSKNFNSSVLEGATGVVVGNGVIMKYLS